MSRIVQGDGFTIAFGRRDGMTRDGAMRALEQDYKNAGLEPAKSCQQQRQEAAPAALTCVADLGGRAEGGVRVQSDETPSRLVAPATLPTSTSPPGVGGLNVSLAGGEEASSETPGYGGDNPHPVPAVPSGGADVCTCGAPCHDGGATAACLLCACSSCDVWVGDERCPYDEHGGEG